jgi:hypothetical protein
VLFRSAHLKYFDAAQAPLNFGVSAILLKRKIRCSASFSRHSKFTCFKGGANRGRRLDGYSGAEVDGSTRIAKGFHCEEMNDHLIILLNS